VLLVGYDKRGKPFNKQGGKNGIRPTRTPTRHKCRYYNEDNYGDENNIFVWRKHARLQEFMAKKWADQNPSVKVEGMLAHLGFNGDQEAPCYMTKEVVKELAEQIDKGFSDYHAEDGFFWGQQFQEESVKDYKEQDMKFLKFCEQAINEGKVVEYWCSW